MLWRFEMSLLAVGQRGCDVILVFIKFEDPEQLHGFLFICFSSFMFSRKVAAKMFALRFICFAISTFSKP